MFVINLNCIPEEIVISFFLAYILTPKRVLLGNEPFAGLLYSLKLATIILPVVAVVNYFYPLRDL